MIEEGAVCCEGWEIDQVKRDNKVRFSWLLIQAQVQCFREERRADRCRGMISRLSVLGIKGKTCNNRSLDHRLECHRGCQIFHPPPPTTRQSSRVGVPRVIGCYIKSFTFFQLESSFKRCLSKYQLFGLVFCSRNGSFKNCPSKLYLPWLVFYWIPRFGEDI